MEVIVYSYSASCSYRLYASATGASLACHGCPERGHRCITYATEAEARPDAQLGGARTHGRFGSPGRPHAQACVRDGPVAFPGELTRRHAARPPGTAACAAARRAGRFWRDAREASCRRRAGGRGATRILYRPAGRTTLDGRYRTNHICAEIRLPFGRLTNVDKITRSICQRGQCAFTQRSTQH